MLDTAIGHGVRWLVSVPVPGEGEERFGVLEVGSAGAGEFAQCDLAFLQGSADCIGAAVQRHADRAHRSVTPWVGQRRSQGDGDRTEFPTVQNAAMRRQPSTFCSLRQDAQM